MLPKTAIIATLVFLLLCTAAFMYWHPGVFPMHGFTGPEDYVPSPAHVRLTGDSWRYISGGKAVMEGEPLDSVQHSYSGYCLVYGLARSCIVLFQVAVAVLALLAITSLAGQAWREMKGNEQWEWLPCLLTGGLFALNPEYAAWHCAIMTESLYISVVCINAWLAHWALGGPRRQRMFLVFTIVFITAFLRPTGWIQLPAVVCYWIYASILTPRRKLGFMLLTAVLFFLFAVCFASRGISNQGPTMKLYTGEVVWQEDLWRVNMPAPKDITRTGIADGLLYGLRHPLASAWLVAKRLFVMFLRIRPSYSRLHNLALLAYHLPIALLGLAALVLLRRHPAVSVITAMVAAHALVVALTFNDNDGRFTLYFTPLLATAAVLLICAGCSKIVALRTTQESSRPAPHPP
ncbi:MAG: hypothetical protein IKP00_05780 [Victivallales bacterium]|nr:hypothetical protein [Victivallales bacterium]